MPIHFDKLELESYIDGYQLRIRLGIEDNPGSHNELTLEADGDGAERPFTLTRNKTYIIGSGDGLIHATFAYEPYVDHLPDGYWGDLTVNSIDADKDQHTSLDISFSLGWEDDEGNEMTIKCSSLTLNT